MPKAHKTSEHDVIQMMKKIEQVNPNALERMIGIAQGILMCETDKRLHKIERSK